MKKLKIILGILVVLLILLVIAGFIVGAHLGDIVKAGMEKVGPKVTQTTLTIDGVNVSLLSGSAGVKGMVLGNPQGFKALQSITVSNASISLEPKSVLSDKIVIHSVLVVAPEITFEGNPLSGNNLTKILDNVKAFTSGSTSGQTTTIPPANTNVPPPTANDQAKAGKKLEVDDFLITGAVVHASLTGIVNKDITVTIPEIHLTDLGKGPEGITAADLTQKILSEITSKTVAALANSATQLGKDALNAAKSTAQDTVNGVLKNSGNVSSNSVDQLKKGLNGLLGK